MVSSFGGTSRHLVQPCAAWFLGRIQAGSPAARNSANAMHSCARKTWCKRRRRGDFSMIRTAIAAARNRRAADRTAAVAQQRPRPPPATPPPVDFSKVEIKTTDLGDNVYMLEGQGGNITVAVAQRRHHHGGRPVRAAARQDQGRHRGDLEPADQISDQHALSRRPHRRERRPSPRTAPPSSPRSMSRSGSRPGPPTA